MCACVYVCAPLACLVLEEARREHQIPWKWSNSTVHHHVGIRNGIQVLSKGSQCPSQWAIVTINPPALLTPNRMQSVQNQDVSPHVVLKTGSHYIDQSVPQPPASASLMLRLQGSHSSRFSPVSTPLSCSHTLTCLGTTSQLLILSTKPFLVWPGNTNYTPLSLALCLLAY